MKQKMSENGLRVLAFAQKQEDDEKIDLHDEQGYHFCRPYLYD